MPTAAHLVDLEVFDNALQRHAENTRIKIESAHRIGDSKYHVVESVIDERAGVGHARDLWLGAAGYGGGGDPPGQSISW